MPLTPLHIIYIWPILRVLKSNRVTAVLGTLTPDLEIPVMYMLGFSVPRGLCHSFAGAITIDALVAIAAAKTIYGWRFIREKLGITDNVGNGIVGPWALASTGALTHVVVDYLHHSYNPLLWPLIPGYVQGPLVRLVGYELSTLFLNVASAIVLAVILLRFSRVTGMNFWRLLASPKKVYAALVEPGS